MRKFYGVRVDGHWLATGGQALRNTEPVLQSVERACPTTIALWTMSAVLYGRASKTNDCNLPERLATLT